MSIAFRSTLALTTPEIVSLVGKCLPLWTVDNGNFFFSAHTLLRLSRVSKTWYHAFLPIIWSVYSLDAMQNVPAHVLARNTMYVRQLCSFSTIPRFTLNEVSYPRLEKIVMYDCHQPLEMLLSRVRTVTCLDLYFYNQDRSTHLRRAVEMARPFVFTVTRISLHGMHYDTFQQLHGILSLFLHLSFLHLTISEASNQSTPPAVMNTPLAIRILVVSGPPQAVLCDGFLEQLILCCPDLERIAVAVEGIWDDDVPRLMNHPQSKEVVSWARKFCLRFRTFSIQARNRGVRTICMSFNALVALAGPEQGKVQHLEASFYELSDAFMEWTVLEGRAIQVLNLEYMGTWDSTSESAEWLVQLLSTSSLVSLKDLRFKRLSAFSYEHSVMIFSSKWKVHMLENLLLSGLSFMRRLSEKSETWPAGCSSTTRWIPSKESCDIDRNLNKDIQRRLQELPILKSVTMNGFSFVKRDH